MSENVLSHVRFTNKSIETVMFWANPCQPDVEVLRYAGMSIDLDDYDKAKYIERADEWYITARLTVDVQQFSSDDDTECMHAHMVLTGGAAMPNFDGCDEDIATEELAANTASSLYSTARTYIEILSSASNVDKFSLPAIDPYAVIADDGEGTEQ